MSDNLESCPRCLGTGFIGLANIDCHPRRNNPCPLCMGSKKVHPLKAKLFNSGQLAEHEAGRNPQQAQNQ